MANEFKILVSGEWRETARRLEVTSPFDGSLVGVTFMASPDDIEDAVRGADAVFQELRAMPSYRRHALLTAVARGLTERSEEIAITIAREAGKPIRDARVEVARSTSTFTIAAAESLRLEGALIPLDMSPGSEGRSAIVRRFPVGPVLGISPFNFPLNLVSHKVAPALACGCPIIIKPASSTPITALILAEIVVAAGWPAGALSVLPSRGADIERLMQDDRIRKLTFTGSPAVGWRLKSLAGERRVTLELGGNAGLIVHSDADIALAARRATVGAFAYAGQVCISVQRIFVQRGVFDAFKEEFIGNVEALKCGDPMDETTDVGPMIDSAEAERTGQWVVEAITGGAELLAGGEARGAFFSPTVLTKTRPTMRVCSDELFAPVVVLEPYDTFDEAIALVNDSRFGLQAGVFTNDIKRAFHAYSALEVGGVIINDVPTYRVDNMPYGGVKQSGFGREGVRYAIEEMTEPRLLALNLS